jgi:hypothetical protein
LTLKAHSPCHKKCVAPRRSQILFTFIECGRPTQLKAPIGRKQPLQVSERKIGFVADPQFNIGEKIRYLGFEQPDRKNPVFNQPLNLRPWMRVYIIGNAQFRGYAPATLDPRMKVGKPFRPRSAHRSINSTQLSYACLSSLNRFASRTPQGRSSGKLSR